MVLRICEMRTSVPPAGVAAGTGVGAVRGATSTGATRAGAAAVPPRAASTSRLTTRPSGPEPAIWPRSSFASVAMRRASGDALTRAPSAAGASPPAWATGALVCSAPYAFSSGAGASVSAGAGTGALGAAPAPDPSPPAPASSSDTSSPSRPRTAISAPMGTLSPSPMTRLRRTPSS